MNPITSDAAAISGQPAGSGTVTGRLSSVTT